MSNKVKIDEEVFSFVYEMAMRDATLQMAYKGEKSAPKKCEDAKKIIRKYIDSLLNDDAPDFYEVEKDFEERINEELKQHGANSFSFTFGNCQKVINMTVKYFYIATYANEELREKFKGCHCPMDGIIIGRIIGELKEITGEKKCHRCPKTNNLFQDIIRGDDKCKDIKEEVLESLTINSIQGAWSQIDIRNNLSYKLYQSVIKYLADKKGVSPIEYDYLVWNNGDPDNQNE